MIETKQEAVLRWKREGRKRAAVADRKRWMEDFFAGGMPKSKAEDKAFEMALEKYPPLTERERPKKQPKKQPKTKKQPQAEAPQAEAGMLGLA